VLVNLHALLFLLLLKVPTQPQVAVTDTIVAELVAVHACPAVVPVALVHVTHTRAIVTAAKVLPIKFAHTLAKLVGNQLLPFKLIWPVLTLVPTRQ
jgi:hypothetical protein